MPNKLAVSKNVVSFKLGELSLTIPKGVEVEVINMSTDSNRIKLSYKGAIEFWCNTGFAERNFLI